MAQLNLYVPDEIADRWKEEARQAKLPLSRYVVHKLTERAEDVWPVGFFENICGFWQGEGPVIEDFPPEPFGDEDTRK